MPLISHFLLVSLPGTSPRHLTESGIRDSCVNSRSMELLARCLGLSKSSRVVPEGRSEWSIIWHTHFKCWCSPGCGPTLFISINDLPDYVLSFIGIFADDTTVFNHTRKNLSRVDLAIGFFYRSSKMLTPEAILYLDYKSQVRPMMEYCAHIWTGTSKASLSVLDRLQYRIKGLVGEELFSSLQPLSHRRNAAFHCSTVITTRDCRTLSALYFRILSSL